MYIENLFASDRFLLKNNVCNVYMSDTILKNASYVNAENDSPIFPIKDTNVAIFSSTKENCLCSAGL